MIKKLAASIREYKKIAMITPVFVALEAIMEVIIPYIIAIIIDSGISQGNLSVVYKMGFAIMGCAILALIFGALAGKCAAEASAGFAKNLRHDMYYKIQDFSFENIDRFSTSSIITRLTTDVFNVKNSFQMILRGVIRAPLMLIFSLIMAFIINPKLALIYIAVTPILVIGLIFISLKAHPHFKKVFKTYDRLNSIVQENVRGIRVVKSFVKEDAEIEKFEETSQDIYNEFSAAEKILAFNGPLMQLTAYTAVLLIAWFGTKFIVKGIILTGQLSTLITYTMNILIALMMLSMLLVMVIISRASAERIIEILDEESSLTNNDKAIKEFKDGSIDFENVQFGYVKDDKEKLCLKNINVNIKSGETIGIIGETGSSKTSFVQLIPRLYDVSEGIVKVGGIDVRDYDLETLRNEVAMVLQKNVLFSGTIKENLRWGNLNASDEEIERVCKLAQADEFIKQFPDKYDTYIEQDGTNVSGGQKQRLCIARALLKKPKILILDDSTSAVDTKTDKLIREAFKNEIPNTTKIIIAQRISSVEDADRIIVLENGEINGIGSHQELLENNEIYKDIYISQVKGGNENEE